MTITFHCEHCGRKIEAAKSAAGKWGRCPGCHNKIYVPDMEVGEELKLAPVDESEEEKRKQLMDETYRLRQRILLEREDSNLQPAPGGTADQVSEKKLTDNIVTYLRLMADGDLDQAQRLAKSIMPGGKKAIELLDRIAVSEVPEPGLSDIPRQVLSGFIRTLRNKLL